MHHLWGGSSTTSWLLKCCDLSVQMAGRSLAQKLAASSLNIVAPVFRGERVAVRDVIQGTKNTSSIMSASQRYQGTFERNYRVVPCDYRHMASQQLTCLVLPSPIASFPPPPQESLCEPTNDAPRWGFRQSQGADGPVSSAPPRAVVVNSVKNPVQTRWIAFFLPELSYQTFVVCVTLSRPLHLLRTRATGF